MISRKCGIRIVRERLEVLLGEVAVDARWQTRITPTSYVAIGIY